MRGSVVKRKGSRGTVYYVVLSGRWYRVPGEVQTARAADLYRAQLLTALHSGELVIDQVRVTVAELAERWQAARAQEWRPGSRSAMANAVHQLILPALGERLVHTVSLEDLQRWRAQALERYAPRTVNIAMSAVKGMLKAAVEWRILRASPAVGLRQARVEPRAALALTHDQVTLVLRAVGDRAAYRAAVLLSLTGGLRVGEVAAARWEHVDWDAATYRVSGTASMAYGYRVGNPKTAGSAAKVVLSPACLVALAAHRGAQAEERLARGGPDGGWMFTRADGSALRPYSLQAWWAATVVEVGLPACAWHTLRHTCAAMLIDGGAHPKVVQQQLRHSTISMTLDTYGHLFPARQNEAVAGLDAALGLGGVMGTLAI